MTDKEITSGFIPVVEHEDCSHPQHFPPTHIVIPIGQAYRHVCPQCRSESVLFAVRLSLSREKL